MIFESVPPLSMLDGSITHNRSLSFAFGDGENSGAGGRRKLNFSGTMLRLVLCKAAFSESILSSGKKSDTIRSQFLATTDASVVLRSLFFLRNVKHIRIGLLVLEIPSGSGSIPSQIISPKSLCFSVKD